MKPIIILSLTIAILVLAVNVPVSAGEKVDNKFVGVKACTPCHKAEKAGKQADIWKGSKHAEAFTVLTTPKAAEVAKAKGLKKPASESPECLECHAVTADAKNHDKAFDIKDGVQCESCNGAGSAYKTMAVMKDHAKAVAAGLVDYKDEAAIEAKCKTCHNEKSPTYKPFKFKEMWGKIAHPVAKK